MDQNLIDKLKAEGLDTAEETVEMLTKKFFKIMSTVAEHYKATWAVPLLGYAESALKPLIDKIDGKVG